DFSSGQASFMAILRDKHRVTTIGSGVIVTLAAHRRRMPPNTRSDIVTTQAVQSSGPSGGDVTWGWAGSTWFWPTIAAAVATKYHWLVITCDACGTVIDLDLTMKQK